MSLPWSNITTKASCWRLELSTPLTPQAIHLPSPLPPARNFVFFKPENQFSVTSMSTESQPVSTLPWANADYSFKVYEKSLPQSPTWKSLYFPWGSTTRTRTSGGQPPQQLLALNCWAKVDLAQLQHLLPHDELPTPFYRSAAKRSPSSSLQKALMNLWAEKLTLYTKHTPKIQRFYMSPVIIPGAKFRW